MFERIMEVDTYVYILWGIGVLGLLLKMMANTYIKSLIKGSENMAMTKNKKLQILARKCKNRQSLGINGKNSDAYVDKNIQKMKFMGRTFAFWQQWGVSLALFDCMLMAGAFLYYDVSWRGSPAMIEFLANGIIVCAFLLALENIFLIKNKVEILKANIKDYIDNLTPAREYATQRATLRPTAKREAAVTEAKAYTEDTGQTSPEMVNQIKQVVKQREREQESDAFFEEAAGKQESSVEERASPPIESDKVLDSFLKEFFS
ncbi:MAG: hypothetical protein K2G45_12935 [Lachnospiraceae bacterium]|nr:hypothetical protein [Lachnospiraceae bacterium]